MWLHQLKLASVPFTSPVTFWIYLDTFPFMQLHQSNEKPDDLWSTSSASMRSEQQSAVGRINVLISL